MRAPITARNTSGALGFGIRDNVSQAPAPSSRWSAASPGPGLKEGDWQRERGPCRPASLTETLAILQAEGCRTAPFVSEFVAPEANLQRPGKVRPGT